MPQKLFHSVIGCASLVLGAYLLINAGPLATRWQPLHSGSGRGGLISPTAVAAYQTVGTGCLIIGMGLVALAIGCCELVGLLGEDEARRTAEGPPLAAPEVNGWRPFVGGEHNVLRREPRGQG